jgi:hypothetical protein
LVSLDWDRKWVRFAFLLKTNGGPSPGRSGNQSLSIPRIALVAEQTRNRSGHPVRNREVVWGGWGPPVEGNRGVMRPRCLLCNCGRKTLDLYRKVARRDTPRALSEADRRVTFDRDLTFTTPGIRLPWVCSRICSFQAAEPTAVSPYPRRFFVPGRRAHSPATSSVRVPTTRTADSNKPEALPDRKVDWTPGTKKKDPPKDKISTTSHRTINLRQNLIGSTGSLDPRRPFLERKSRIFTSKMRGRDLAKWVSVG